MENKFTLSLTNPTIALFWLITLSSSALLGYSSELLNLFAGIAVAIVGLMGVLMTAFVLIAVAVGNRLQKDGKSVSIFWGENNFNFKPLPSNESVIQFLMMMFTVVWLVGFGSTVLPVLYLFFAVMYLVGTHISQTILTRNSNDKN